MKRRLADATATDRVPFVARRFVEHVGGLTERELATGVAWLEEVRAEALAVLEELRVAPPESLVEREIEFSSLNAGLDELEI